MARKELDGHPSREKDMGTQEETGPQEEKAVMKTPRKLSREPSKGPRKPLAACPSNAALNGKKGKRPSQETTDNLSIESGKQLQKGKLIKKPSAEKIDTSKSGGRKAYFEKPGDEVTPPGLSNQEMKETDKKQQRSLHGLSWTFSNRPNEPGSAKAEKAFVAIEEQVAKLPYFHGFICREDLNILLRKPGDWLIRISVMPNEKKAKKKEEKDDGKPVTMSKETVSARRNHKFFVLSVLCKEKERSVSPAFGVLKSTFLALPVRSLIIRNVDGKLNMDTGKTFKSIAELVSFYQRNIGLYKGAEFQLLSPVPLSSWEIQHEDVELLEKKLGEGAFGDVRVGRMKTKEQKKPLEVAVKMLKNADSVSRDQVAELLHEARVMRLLDHKNVLRTFGIAVLKEPLYLMSELCTCGALREYLKDHRKTITLADKLAFVLGSARGVEYLHSQKIIHRDLAVRNILLTEDKTPKVSDFGLAKLTEKYEMREQCKIPIRYLAPETLELYIFTSKTDVFSFGCVIWEIYENGQQPHDGKNATTIRAQSKKCQFLRLPSAAPDELRKLVSQRVFVSDPENRCSMGAIVQCVEKVDQSTKK